MTEFYTAPHDQPRHSTTRVSTNNEPPTNRGSESEVVFSGNPTGADLLVITEDRNAPSRPRHSIGLYHLALRYATRSDLAGAYRRLIEAGYPADGASDHGVSEALYLTDPDGDGVELYADRPRAQWPWENGQVAMVTAPLDLDNLFASRPTKTPRTNEPPQPDLGHIHLHVADLHAAERFYREYLGLEVTQRSYRGALFFAAGNYHHHIAVNVWAGNVVPPANSVGLISYRMEVPVREVLYCLKHRAPLLGYETRMGSPEEASPVLQIRDPNGNWLEIHASKSTMIGSGLPAESVDLSKTC
jgi:catechol 2,3-dioxygenase